MRSPRIDVFNKCDRVEAGDLRPHGADICSISARTGEGVDRLLEMIDRRLDKGTRRVTIHLPYDKGGLLDMLYREAKVESVEYSETIDIVAVCPPKVLGQIGDYTPTGRRRKRTGNDHAENAAAAPRPLAGGGCRGIVRSGVGPGDRTHVRLGTPRKRGGKPGGHPGCVQRAGGLRDSQQRAAHCWERWAFSRHRRFFRSCLPQSSGRWAIGWDGRIGAMAL